MREKQNRLISELTDLLHAEEGVIQYKKQNEPEVPLCHIRIRIYGSVTLPQP